MPSITKIMLPVDFSERCLGATRYMEALSARFNSEIILVHVVEPLQYDLTMADPAAAALSEMLAGRTEGARRQLDSFLVKELGNAAVRRVVLEGDSAQKIVEYAHSERVELITMPTHGLGPFRRFILGSVTAKVLHDADCPVWTGIHMEEAPVVERIQFRNILCAVDLGPQSRKALCWAAHLAAAFDAKLIAMHSVPAIESGPGEYFDRQLVADLSKAAHEELEKLTEGLETPATILVAAGHPADAVSDAADESHADLLVIARGSAGGAHGRLRTNAYSIIRESPCPVVSV